MEFSCCPTNRVFSRIRHPQDDPGVPAYQGSTWPGVSGEGPPEEVVTRSPAGDPPGEQPVLTHLGLPALRSRWPGRFPAAPA